MTREKFLLHLNRRKKNKYFVTVQSKHVFKGILVTTTYLRWEDNLFWARLIELPNWKIRRGGGTQRLKESSLRDSRFVASPMTNRSDAWRLCERRVIVAFFVLSHNYQRFTLLHLRDEKLWKRIPVIEGAGAQGTIFVIYFFSLSFCFLSWHNTYVFLLNFFYPRKGYYDGIGFVAWVIYWSDINRLDKNYRWGSTAVKTNGKTKREVRKRSNLDVRCCWYTQAFFDVSCSLHIVLYNHQLRLYTPYSRNSSLFRPHLFSFLFLIIVFTFLFFVHSFRSRRKSTGLNLRSLLLIGLSAAGSSSVYTEIIIRIMMKARRIRVSKGVTSGERGRCEIEGRQRGTSKERYNTSNQGKRLRKKNYRRLHRAQPTNQPTTTTCRLRSHRTHLFSLPFRGFRERSRPRRLRSTSFKNPPVYVYTHKYYPRYTFDTAAITSQAKLSTKLCSLASAYIRPKVSIRRRSKKGEK